MFTCIHLREINYDKTLFVFMCVLCVCCVCVCVIWLCRLLHVHAHVGKCVRDCAFMCVPVRGYLCSHSDRPRIVTTLLGNVTKCSYYPTHRSNRGFVGKGDLWQVHMYGNHSARKKAIYKQFTHTSSAKSSFKAQHRLHCSEKTFIQCLLKCKLTITKQRK